MCPIGGNLSVAWRQNFLPNRSPGPTSNIRRNQISPFSALRAEGVESPSIGSSPSIERRGTSPRSVVVASCFSVSDPTKTKSTPIVFFVYRTLSIHFRTDRAFSIPGLRAHAFTNALSSFWSFSGVKSAKGWSGSTQFALGWEVKERPLVGLRPAAPLGVCGGLYTEFCPPSSEFDLRRRLTDHSSGPVLANGLKRRPEKRALRRRTEPVPLSCEGLSLLPFSGRGLPSPASRRGTGSSYLSFSPLPRAPRGAVRRCVFCGTFRRGKRPPPPSRWEAPCPAELGLSSAALFAAAIRRPPKTMDPPAFWLCPTPRWRGRRPVIVGMAGPGDVNQLHFFKSGFQFFDSGQKHFHACVFGAIDARHLIHDELGIR
jgi:hypothetical protein